MKLPQLRHPERYAGLYVVDFGPTVSVGYTAEEVAMLLESEATADAKVYRIHRAEPDGTMELKGVPGERFRLETGLFFHSRNIRSARRDFEAIRRLADDEGPPCRAQLLLGAREVSSRLPFVVGLAYPAECDEDVARWLLENKVTAGEYADGGIGRLEWMRGSVRLIETAQLRAAPKRRPRTRREVLASTDKPIQRTA